MTMIKACVLAETYRQFHTDGTSAQRRRGDIIEIEEAEVRRIPWALKPVVEAEREAEAAKRPLVDASFEALRDSVRAAFDSQKNARRAAMVRELEDAQNSLEHVDKTEEAPIKRGPGRPPKVRPEE